MSADWWLTLADDVEGPSFNVTYNLSPMLREAGWTWPDGRVWSKEYIEGAVAADIGEKAMYVLRNLESEPDKYRAFNPPNGWGSYEGLVEEWRRFIESIREHPTATIGCWF